MQKLNKFTENHPIALSAIVAITFLLLNQLAGWSISWLLRQSLSSFSGYFLNLWLELFAVIMAIAFVIIINGKNVLLNKGVGFLKGMPVAAFPIIMSTLAIILSISTSEGETLPFGQIIVFVLFVICVGIAEELIFRCCIVNILARKYLKNSKGIYCTVFLSGLIFGMAHLVNILSGLKVSSVIIQSILAIVVGWLYSAIYIRTKNIWLLAFIHALNNFGALLNSGVYGVETVYSAIAQYSPIKLISIIIYLIPILYIIRKSKSDEILKLHYGTAQE